MSPTIKNLYKKFDDKVIFDGFSYIFSDTGVYVIKGKSGIGKTTILRIMSGLDKDYSGEVDGFRGRVGVAFQEYRLFPNLTALQNVLFADFDTYSEAEIQKSEEVLFSLGFNNKDLGLLPSELSGGMKQRVSLARAFVSSFPILLLDEPTKELDEKNANIVREIIRSHSKDRLIIVVSHNEEDAWQLNATKIILN